MRIAINALSVQSGAGLIHLSNLLRHLRLVGPHNEYVVLVTKAKAESLGVADGSLPHLRIITCPAWGWAARASWEQTWLPVLLRRERVDVLYAPGNQGPVLSPCPFVVVIQAVNSLVRDFDGLPLAFRFQLYGLRLLMCASTRRARKVIAVSAYTQRLLAYEFGLNPQVISIIPYGRPEDTNLPLSDKGSRQFNKYEVKDPYLLAVSNITYNKNYERLLEAFILASQRISHRINLVIAGEVVHKWCFPSLLRIVENNGLTSRVRFLGGVEPDALRLLYQGALGLISPSRLESFGLPLLEAMTYGIPVAASLIESAIEVCGDAALYFDPNDPLEMATTIVRLVKEEGLRKDLVQRGLSRAKRFSWEWTARRTLEVLEAAVAA